MKTKLTLMTVLAMTAFGIQTVSAGNVAWSVGISSGGFAAGVASGPWAPAPVYVPAPLYAPPPVYVRPAPVYVQPARVYVQPAPVVVATPGCVAPVPVYAPYYVPPRPFFGFRIDFFGGHGHHHHR